jgi:hypothetical protein
MRVFIGNYPKGDKERPVRVKIDRWDTWSMDHTLALIIHPMLIQLKEQKHGSPYTDDDEVPEHLRSTAAPPKENEYDVDANHDARWDWMLDEMIWAFDTMIADNDTQHYYVPYGPDEVVEPFMVTILKEDGTEEEQEFMGVEEVREMGRLDEEKRRAHMDRKRNAFILFGKHFQSLWS